MMETQVQFPKFIQALKDVGVHLPGASVLQNPNGAWFSVPREVRARYLQSLSFDVDPDQVEVQIRKKGAKGARGLDNVYVIFKPRGESPERPAPKRILDDAPPAAAPLVSAAAEAAAESADAAQPPQPAEALEAPESNPTPEPLAAPMPEPAAAPMPEPAAAQAAAEPEESGLVPADDPEEAPESAMTAMVESMPRELEEVFESEVGLALPDEPAAARGLAVPDEPAAALPVEVAASASALSAEVQQPPARKGLFGRFKRRQEEPAVADAAAPAEPLAVTDFEREPEEGIEVVEVYPVQEPYAYVRILHDHDNHEHRYEVVEPDLNEREKNILDFIENTIIDVIEIGLSAMTREEAAEMLRKHVDEVIYDYSIVLNPVSREKMLYYILRDFLGFGKLDPIMRDEFIEDVSCDGPGIPIFLYHRKYESVKSMTVFEGEHELDSFVIRMAQRSGKHVSIAEPLLDATLPEGSRLNATLSDEVTDGGSTFTIRKFREDPFTFPDLVRFGTMNEDILAYWWLAVQNGASAIYAGGTASGKTTSLNAILLFIPPQMKIVSIEDTREVNMPHENWIAGVTRSGFGPRDNNGRQAGEIDMFTLLKAALRQRPEYILVGEVRGAEATALFQAMATGHTAYGTMHADSAEAVIHRLESEPISIPRSLLEALDIVSIQIQTRIGDRRVRRTKELIEIVGLDPHTREILTNEVFSWSPATDEFEFSGVSYVLERIQLERNMSESDMREEYERRKRIIRWMVDNDVRSLEDVGRIVATYYKDPKKILKLIEEMPAAAPEEVHEAVAAAGGATKTHAAQEAASDGAARGGSQGPRSLELVEVDAEPQAEPDAELSRSLVPTEPEETHGAE